MKVTIDKELLDKLLASIEPVKEFNWIDNIQEKHRKFAAYWEELGRPMVEFTNTDSQLWFEASDPDWTAEHYRIKDDPHWELRLKWINSGKTLPIESFIYSERDGKKWQIINSPMWHEEYQYREAKPWYEQEISEEKPILLKGINSGKIEVFRTYDVRDKHFFTPLTDQEIDALKRGF